MSKKWVFIDLSFLSYRAMHVMGDLAAEEGGTGVIFGVLDQIKSICNDPLVNSKRVCIFADSRHSYRKKAYPGYKSGRVKNRTEEEIISIKEMRRQGKILIKEVFPAIGVQCYRQKGLEADDVIAEACSNSMQHDDRAVMITSDQDMYQCLRDPSQSHQDQFLKDKLDTFDMRTVDWYDPQRHKYNEYSDILKSKGISPAAWGEVKALGGCTSDTVPGIDKVGEKSAIRWLLGTLPTDSAYYRRIADADADEIKLWRSLVVLPHVKTKAFDIKEPEWNYQEFRRICTKYEFESFLNSREWSDFFDQNTRKRGDRKRKRKNLLS